MRSSTLFLLLASALSLVPVTLSVKDSQARIGRPLTPFSVAGVHRRHVRRAFVAGAALGPAAYTAGVLPYGRGCSCGWHNWHGYNVYPGIGAGGFGSGFGWRPGFGVGAPGFGWHRGWW